MKKTVIRLAVLFVALIEFQAVYAGCETIKDGKKRLQCFDKLYSENQDKAEKNASEAKVKDALNEAMSAIRALKKMKARVSSGISYREYSSPLAEARYEVDQFLQSPASSMIPDVTKNISDAIDHYVFSGRVWAVKFAGGRPLDGMSRFESPEIYDTLESKYGVHDHVTNNGFFGSHNVGKLYAASLPVVWSFADRSISVAEQAIKNGGKQTAPCQPIADGDPNIDCHNQTSSPSDSMKQKSESCAPDKNGYQPLNCLLNNGK